MLTSYEEGLAMNNERKTVLVSGHFNIIHPGHLRLLRFAKECGTSLIVAVESDRLAGASAHVPENLRLEGVASNSYVDKAFLIDVPIEEIIKDLRPDVVVKGKEHETRNNSEAKVLEAYGGKLLFSSGEAVFSSIDLIRREFSEVVVSTIHLPNGYLARNVIDHKRLIKLCESFSNLKVVVIGDLIVDEYITCQPLGMSQEDPTIVVSPIDSVCFVGGAGIVAAHAAGLGAHVNFISVSGRDTSHIFAKETLEKYNVKTHLFEDISRPTTLKQRYRSKGKSLLRVSHLHQEAISVELQQKIIALLTPILESADLLVFSDFNYGCLPQPLVEQLTKIAKSHGVLLAAESQSSSHVGDISRFKQMDLITPTEREARIATRNHEDGLVVLAENLRQQSQAKSVLLKMGEEGLLIHAWSDANKEIITDQVPALNSHPKDVAGAGDSLLITSSMAMACGADIWETAFLGSLAAGIQVGRVGNIPLRLNEFTHELELQGVSHSIYQDIS
jgi:rfaE bifunctional protein kinase chain/domain